MKRTKERFRLPFDLCVMNMLRKRAKNDFGFRGRKSYISQVIYRTRAIITRSRFETALEYKPRIFQVRKVSWYYKPLCNINRGLYTIKN